MDNSPGYPTRELQAKNLNPVPTFPAKNGITFSLGNCLKSDNKVYLPSFFSIRLWMINLANPLPSAVTYEIYSFRDVIE